MAMADSLDRLVAVTYVASRKGEAGLTASSDESARRIADEVYNEWCMRQKRKHRRNEERSAKGLKENAQPSGPAKVSTRKREKEDMGVPEEAAVTPKSSGEQGRQRKQYKKRRSTKDGGHEPKGLQECFNKILKMWLNSIAHHPEAYGSFDFAKVPRATANDNINLPADEAIIHSEQEEKLMKPGKPDTSLKDWLHKREMQVAHNNGLSNAAYLTQKRRTFMADAIRQYYARHITKELKTELNANRAQLCASVDVVKMSNLAKNWAHWGMSKEKGTIDQFKEEVYEETETADWFQKMLQWAEDEAAKDSKVEKVLAEGVRKYLPST